MANVILLRVQIGRAQIRRDVVWLWTLHPAATGQLRYMWMWRKVCANRRLGERPGVRNIGVTCHQCGASVIPQGAINWLLFIIFLLLCCPAAVIYLLVQSGKPPTCPVCGGSSFEYPTG